MPAMQNVFTDVGNPVIHAQAFNDNFNQVNNTQLFNVMGPAYGAKCDGVTDDTTAIQAAINAAQTVHGTVVIPGKSVITALTITDYIGLMGYDSSTGGSQLIAKASSNVPMLTITAACTVRELGFSGTADATLTNQDCILASGAHNNIFLRNCWFTGGTNLLHINGDSFYCFAINCTFKDAKNAQIKGESAGTTTGYAWNFVNCLGLPGTGFKPAYCLQFNDIGALQFDGCIFEGQNATTRNVLFDTAAPSYGGLFFNNTIFENNGLTPGVYFKGTLAKPLNEIYAAATSFGGGSTTTDGAVELGYVTQFTMSAGQLTGLGRGMQIHNAASNIVLSNVVFNPGTQPPIGMDAAATITGLTITDPTYTGGQIFLYLANASATSQLQNITVRGCKGSMGSNASPIAIGANPTPTSVQVDVMGVNKGALAAPTMPASTVTLINPFFTNCMVSIYGGTVTVISIDGVAQGVTSGQFVLPAGRTIALTYTVAPTWVWTGL